MPGLVPSTLPRTAVIVPTPARHATDDPNTAHAITRPRETKTDDDPLGRPCPVCFGGKRGALSDYKNDFNSRPKVAEANERCDQRSLVKTNSGECRLAAERLNSLLKSHGRRVALSISPSHPRPNCKRSKAQFVPTRVPTILVQRVAGCRSAGIRGTLGLVRPAFMRRAAMDGLVVHLPQVCLTTSPPACTRPSLSGRRIVVTCHGRQF